MGKAGRRSSMSASAVASSPRSSPSSSKGRGGGGGSHSPSSSSSSSSRVTGERTESSGSTSPSPRENNSKHNNRKKDRIVGKISSSKTSPREVSNLNPNPNNNNNNNNSPNPNPRVDSNRTHRGDLSPRKNVNKNKNKNNESNHPGKIEVVRYKRSVLKKENLEGKETFLVTLVASSITPHNRSDAAVLASASAAALSHSTEEDSPELPKKNRLKETRKKSKVNKALLNHIKTSVLGLRGTPSPLFCPAAPSYPYMFYSSAVNSPSHISVHSSSCVCDSLSVGSGSDADYCPHCGMLSNSQFGNKNEEDYMTYICLSPI